MTTHSFAARLTAAAAIPVLTALVATPSAFAQDAAAPTPAQAKILNTTQGGQVDDGFAGSYGATVEGTDMQVFCIEKGVAVDYTKTYVATSRAGSKRPGLDRASAIAANHTKLGTPLSDADAEAAATQMAIWTHTNPGYDISKSAAVKMLKDRANFLVANGGVLAEGPSSLALTSNAVLEADTVVLSVVAKTLDGVAIPGLEVKVDTPTQDTTLTTGADGAAEFRLPATEDKSAVAAFSATMKLPAGTALVAPGSQAMITDRDGQIVRSASAALPFLVPAAPEPTKPPVVPVVKPATPPVVAAPPAPPAPRTRQPQPAEPREELPFTGTETTLAMLLGAAGLAGLGFGLRKKFSS